MNVAVPHQENQASYDPTVELVLPTDQKHIRDHIVRAAHKYENPWYVPTLAQLRHDQALNAHIATTPADNGNYTTGGEWVGSAVSRPLRHGTNNERYVLAQQDVAMIQTINAVAQGAQVKNLLPPDVAKDIKRYHAQLPPHMRAATPIGSYIGFLQQRIDLAEALCNEDPATYRALCDKRQAQLEQAHAVRQEQHKRQLARTAFVSKLATPSGVAAATTAAFSRTASGYHGSRFYTWVNDSANNGERSKRRKLAVAAAAVGTVALAYMALRQGGLPLPWFRSQGVSDQIGANSQTGGLLPTGKSSLPAGPATPGTALMPPDVVQPQVPGRNRQLQPTGGHLQHLTLHQGSNPWDMARTDLQTRGYNHPSNDLIDRYKDWILRRKNVSERGAYSLQAGWQAPRADDRLLRDFYEASQKATAA